MRCATCGTELAEGEPFCANCGTAESVHAQASPGQHASGPATSPSLRHSGLNPAAPPPPPLPRPPARPGEERTVRPVRVNELLAGRYLLEQKVGEGGMGTVFVAHDLQLERRVAVKLLSAALVHDPEVVERFDREARLTAKLDHPNIVPIYDVGKQEGRPFIVMKLLEGDSLAGLIRTKGSMASDELLRLFRQLAAGLDYIHGQGFIHRDIKAGNIFVARDGTATILDFGILRSRKASAALTRTGMVMGTPHYMAPEQALGLKDVDHRVDLYALAVVLFECLTGSLPFEADSELRLIQMQAHQPPPEILERAPWIPAPVAEVMRRALAKKPDERYQSAHALVAALEDAHRQSAALPVVVAEVPPVPAVPAEPPEPPAPPRRATLVWGGLAAALALTGLAGLWWARPAGTSVAPPGAPTTVDLEPAPSPALVAAANPILDAGEGAALALVDAGAAEELDGGAQGPEPDEPRPTAAVGPPRRRRGTLNVVTTHSGETFWAEVSVDGVPRGRTPWTGQVEVGGTYVVSVARQGFRSQTREIRVASGRPTVVRFELVP